MPTPQPRVAPEVESELDAIWVYIASSSDSLEIADRTIDRITEYFSVLANNPYIGRRRDADLRPGLRSFPVGNYLILYRIEQDVVLILHVVHGRRDLEAWLNE
jgi:toxin ParE1/3/4